VRKKIKEVKMDIEEIKSKVKRKYLREHDKEYHGRAYYNWTHCDDRIVELAIDETVNSKDVKQ
jgi:hypothetical protein